LTLVGNYTDGYVYWAKSIYGSEVTFENNPADTSDLFPATQAAFDTTFPTDGTALVRIRKGSDVYYSTIGAGIFPTRKITLNPTPNIGDSCEGCEINVVNQIRYSVVTANAPEDGTASLLTLSEQGLADQKILSVSERTDLVRDVLSWEDGKMVRREVVAENVGDFQVWFLFNADTAGSTGPAVNQVKTMIFPDSDTGSVPCSAGTLGAGMCQVKNALGALVRISVRTSREDPNFLAPTGVNRPLQWFNIDPASAAAARVRTLVSQVALPNIRYQD